MTRETGALGVGGIGTRCQIDIGEDGWYSWRLTANNGRVIALGAVTHPDEKACRAAFEALCEAAASLLGGVQHAAESNGWIWRLRDADGEVRAVSSRAYERHSTCQAAYDRFRVLLLDLGAAPSVPWGDAH
ncbi:hypothetical protein SAMN05216223_102561 [Actinacidiphila yanglinensis]|uniref:DUF1508 domain-containing protein n=1 Tax=Actinacidiphila yanglinensis TaxID=310779 RepID=A0A1H5W575_9ACTN|nr:hypothetical protein [Actinacidiphila yanglinensis]SEF94543.1 hypothetical protein SAMN05216223_102561 [Actinacidiphila yanglinensis]